MPLWSLEGSMSWKLEFTVGDVGQEGSRRGTCTKILLQGRGKDWSPCICDLVLINEDEGLAEQIPRVPG